MRSLLARWYGPYGQATVWKQTAHLLADLPVGIGLFTAVVTLLSLSLGLMVTLVGFPLLMLTVLAGRWMGALERGRVHLLLDADLPGPSPLDASGGLVARTKRAMGDTAGWKGLAYGALMLPWGIITFTLAVVLWTVTFTFATLPLWGWFGDPPPVFEVDGVSYNVNDIPLPIALGVPCVLGLLMMAALPRLVNLLAQADMSLARALLVPNREAQLQQRVEQLRESRDASVDSSASELRRIERDLHDGAQQRLVSLAMNLGMAKDRLSESDDPRTRAMVEAAHGDAKHAIAELRDLVRGIHPAVLTDRGLDAAVSALVARCPVPVALSCDVPGRLPAAVESTAYFVVAEALTNVAKHSGATSASVRLQVAGDHLMVEVLDNGRGGAEAAAGTGLRGLRDRVAGVEGALDLSSPVGGPTVLTVELPCAS